jgi:hypothetical protein
MPDLPSPPPLRVKFKHIAETEPNLSFAQWFVEQGNPPLDDATLRDFIGQAHRVMHGTRVLLVGELDIEDWRGHPLMSNELSRFVTELGVEGKPWASFEAGQRKYTMHEISRWPPNYCLLIASDYAQQSGGLDFRLFVFRARKGH